MTLMEERSLQIDQRNQQVRTLDQQIKTLETQEKKLQRLIPEVAALQKQWQSALVDGCGDLFGAVLTYEGKLIRHALENAGGSVARAALSLGMSCQALVYIIDTRQQSLLRFRSVKRARSPKGDK